MGNYSFNVVNKPRDNSVATIVHSQFTKDEEFPDRLLRTGEKVKIVKTTNLLKSRSNFPDITVSKVLIKDAKTGTLVKEAYFTNNLKT